MFKIDVFIGFKLYYIITILGLMEFDLPNSATVIMIGRMI